MLFPPGSGCRLIAEAGTGHRSDPARAAELIDAAAEAGADCVKFQAVFADELLHPLTGNVALPGGKIDLYRRFRELEQDADFYRTLKERSERRGLLFLCSAFGLRSARMLRAIDVRALKIASPELNHLPLLREVAGYGIPVVLSTGVSRLADIERALDVVGEQIALLLHCVTAYPAPEEEYNLRVLPPMRELFGVPVGVSDHSLDPVLVPAVSAALGATAVEKHFTLDRSGGALDDPIALEPAALARTARALREVIALTDPLEALRREYGAQRIEAVLGSGRKRLAPSERANYGSTNRSLHALRDLPAGAVLDESNIAVLRTEKNLRPGLGPEYLELVLGRPLQRPVAAGDGIVWDDILPPRRPAATEASAD